MWTKYLKIPEFMRVSKRDVEDTIKTLNLPKGSKVLDVGCAYGRISLFLKSVGFDVTAVDKTPEMVKFAKEKGINALEMDANKMKFQDSSFDMVITDGLLEHPEDEGEVRNIISEELRVSKKYVLNFIPKDNISNIFFEKIQRVPKEYRNRDWLSIHKSVAKGHTVKKISLLRLDAYLIEKIS